MNGMGYSCVVWLKSRAPLLRPAIEKRHGRTKPFRFVCGTISSLVYATELQSNLICNNLIYTSPGYVWDGLKAVEKAKNCVHPIVRAAARLRCAHVQIMPIREST